MGKWIPNPATLTEPRRKLLLVSNWEKQLSTGNTGKKKAFNQLKHSLTIIQTLGYYEPKDRTQVVADASPVGLGAVLIQYDSKGSFDQF